MDIMGMKIILFTHLHVIPNLYVVYFEDLHTVILHTVQQQFSDHICQATKMDKKACSPKANV